jgi:hypothetical protein
LLSSDLTVGSTVSRVEASKQAICRLLCSMTKCALIRWL